MTDEGTARASSGPHEIREGSISGTVTPTQPPAQLEAPPVGAVNFMTGQPVPTPGGATATTGEAAG